jgi:DNA (cytosine-5)-methyltransferase 1
VNHAYYNEHDIFASAWLGELMKDGLIAPGEIDTRSIEDVRPDDLRGFAQCHFFAGIGVWSAALRRAGWADDRPIWTGSCPCQPFSAAGKGGGFADERHLWPAFFHLIEQCGPAVVCGEQVASKDGLGWLDLVQTDLERAGYAFGAVDTCAAGFGAPHIRQRLYWAGVGLADANHARLEGWPTARERAAELPAGPSVLVGRMADADGGDAGAERQQRGREQRQQPQDGGAVERLADTDEGQCGRLPTGEGRQSDGQAAGRQQSDGEPESGGVVCRPGPTNGLWAAADWLGCRDGKWRPVEPGTFPLAHAGTFRNRVAELRGAGNAINLAQAEGFVEAVDFALGRAGVAR